MDNNRVISEPYNHNDPYHMAKWLAAGKPSLQELDADGQPWAPTIIEAWDEVAQAWVRHPTPTVSTRALLASWDEGRRAAYEVGRSDAMDALGCHGLAEGVVLLAGTAFVEACGPAIPLYQIAGSKNGLLTAIEAIPAEGDFAWLAWEMATPADLPTAPQQPAPEGAETIKAMLLRVLSSVP